MKTVAIIQARMGSTRLPGKILLPLGDKAILSHVVNRVKEANMIDDIVIATTTNAIDDCVVSASKQYKVQCYRGSEADVLARYYEAATHAAATTVIRVTADCPLLDSNLLNEMIKYFEVNQFDYVTNSLHRTYPRGFDVEIFTMQALSKCHNEATLAYQREHVTPFIYEHPELFNIHNYAANENHAAYRLTLDTPEDYVFLQSVYGKLIATKGENFTTQDLIHLLQAEPALLKINKHIQQKALMA